MINWGLVGTGAIASKRVTPALKADGNSELVAVCDISEQRARDLAVRYGVPRVYTSFEELLGDSRVDAVYLATPVFLHGPQAIRALKAGKHVLVEKPMALTLAEAEEMIGAAREAGLTLATAYYRRFFPKVRRTQQIIGEGILGKVLCVVSIYHTWYNPHPDDPGAWRLSKQQAGGGVLWDMGSHRFDLLIGLFGMATEVWAVAETLAHEYQVEDTASVYLKLGNGAQCVSTWQWSSQTWVDHLSIIGTHGKIVMEPVDSPNLTLYVGAGRSQERFDEQIALPENVHLPMIQDFTDSVLSGVDPVEVGEEGLKVNRVLAAIEESAASGRIVVF
jgi:predicted dehydrogenase